MNAKVFWDLSYGVYITTTFDGDRPVGCVTNSAMQITAEPASIAVSVNKENYTHDCILKSGRFAMTVMAEQAKPLEIGTFGFRSSRDIDKFEKIAWKTDAGVPVVTEGAVSYLVCELVKTLDCDTHTVFLGKVIAAERVDDAARPMTYEYYHRVIKGRAPKTAPTYIAPEEPAAKKKPVKWVCTVCGYVYDGPDIPNDFVCPICGKDITYFVKKYE